MMLVAASSRCRAAIGHGAVWCLRPMTTMPPCVACLRSSTAPTFLRAAAVVASAIWAHDAGRRQRSACVTACAGGERQLSAEDRSAVEAKLVDDVVGAFPDRSASWVTAGHVQRMLCATCGDEALASAKLKQSVAWKRDVLDRWRAEQAEILRATETRVIAIGQQGRPLIYSGCVNQRRGEVAGKLLACVWDQALQEAGPTAQMDYVLDGHGYQPLLNLDIMPYLRVAGSLDSYFAERFHRIIIIDMPTVLVWVVRAIMPLLPTKTRDKLCVVQRSDPEQMQKLYDLCVDEDMRKMLSELLQMNKLAKSSSEREVTHALTNSFLAYQRDKTVDL